MIRFVLFSGILLTVAVGLKLTTDDLLKLMGLELDKDCTSSKVPSYGSLVDEFSNCESVKLAFSLVRVRPSNIKNEYCGVKKLKKCSDEFKDKLGPCLNEAQINILNNTSKSDDAVHEYICNTGKVDVKALLTFDITKCTVNYEPDDCVKLRLAQTSVKPEDFYNKENCLKRIEDDKCMMNVFDYCEDRSAYNFIKKLNEVDLNATPCKQYNRAISISNPTILIYLTIIFLHFRCLS